MKRIVLLVAVISIIGCGYTSKDNEMMGQVKKVLHNTPLICPNYVDADVSLGVMRNGVGSLSTQDTWVVIQDKYMEEVFKEASSTGKLVKITYDTKRFGGNYVVCTPNKFATKIEIID